MSVHIAHLKVRIVSPTLVGGAESKALDSPAILRPPAVRGALRFWSRALSQDPRHLETSLFGSTSAGQRTGISPPAELSGHVWQDFQILAASPPRRNSPFRAKGVLAPGTETTLRFRLPPGFTKEARKQLAAVVWTWLHLGSIGLRSRRGLGSLQWVRKEDDLIAGADLELPAPPAAFTHAGAIANYLNLGLQKVAAILTRPSGSLLRRAPGFGASDWFQLKTLDQVFVGKPIEFENGRLPSDDQEGWEEAVQLLHGRRWSDRGGATPDQEKRQMGEGGSARLASPMLWRVFRCEAQSGSLCIVPIMTWSPIDNVRSLTAGTDMAGYLVNDLGFRSSLIGGTLA